MLAYGLCLVNNLQTICENFFNISGLAEPGASQIR